MTPGEAALSNFSAELASWAAFDMAQLAPALMEAVGSAEGGRSRGARAAERRRRACNPTVHSPLRPRREATGRRYRLLECGGAPPRRTQGEVSRACRRGVPRRNLCRANSTTSTKPSVTAVGSCAARVAWASGRTLKRLLHT